MRSRSGRVFLLASLFVGCSLFPDRAPIIGSVRDAGAGGGAAGADSTIEGTGGANADTGGASGGSVDAGGASGGALAASGGRAEDARANDATIVDANPDVVGDATGDASIRSVTYVASVADCVEAVTLPQPGSCLAYSASIDGPNELWVDIRRSGHRPFTTYLMFPIDSTVANHTIDDLELMVSVTTYTNAPGSGADVWEVVPFTAQSLYVQAPAQVGGKPLAKSPGAAAASATVTYTLPPVLRANEPVYLALFPPTGGDGTGYWGINGDPKTEAPPKLVVKYH